MRTAKDLIGAMFDAQTASRAETFSSLFTSWERCAGTDIAAHSKIIDVAHGSLVVEVDHPGWIQMIRIRERQILTALTKGFPSLEIKALKVRASARPDGKVEDGNTNQQLDEEVEQLRDANSEEYQEFKSLLERFRSLGDEEE